MGYGRKPNIRLHLERSKHKAVIQTCSGPIKIRYRRYKDERGRWRHELIGPFDLTDQREKP